MIGVAVSPADHAVVAEFFELFKTPWQFYRRDRRYEVLLCAGDGEFHENAAKLVVSCSGQKLAHDIGGQIQIASQRRKTRILSYGGMRIPIYGDSITFRDGGNGTLVDEESYQSALQLEEASGRISARIGYDLFYEIRVLL